MIKPATKSAVDNPVRLAVNDVLEGIERFPQFFLEPAAVGQEVFVRRNSADVGFHFDIVKDFQVFGDMNRRFPHGNRRSRTVNLEGKTPSNGRREDPAGHSWKETLGMGFLGTVTSLPAFFPRSIFR